MRLERTLSGVSVVELMIGVLALAILGGLATSAYLFGANAMRTHQALSAARAELTQAVDTTVGMVRQAHTIDAISAGSLSFSADLGAGDNSYRLYLYNDLDPEPNPPFTQTQYQLRLAEADIDYGAGAVLLRHVQPPGPAPFSVDGAVITLDWTVMSAGTPVRLRTAVRPRNL